MKHLKLLSKSEKHNLAKDNTANSLARKFAMQFLYQCEVEKIYFFQQATFESFVDNFDINPLTVSFMKTLVRGVFDQMPEVDDMIKSVADNWNIDRLAFTDRAILRLALYELNYMDTPKKVVINEAIELAKEHGTEKSGGFVNALLDKIHKK